MLLSEAGPLVLLGTTFAFSWMESSGYQEHKAAPFYVMVFIMSGLRPFVLVCLMT